MSRRLIIDELEFEVPYGKLVAKTWHEETDESKRILVLHGWMDNSGSFDTLMPLLKHKDGLYIVALDLPGHGKSSQLPPGSSYSDLNIMMEIRRCILELNWNQPVPKKKRINGDGAGAGMVDSPSQNSIASDCRPAKKFTILGHSMGAGLGMYYASLFPDDVDEVISLDFIKSKTLDIEQLLNETAETIDQFIETVPARSPFASPTLSNATPTRNKIDKGQVIVSQEAAIIATIEAHKQLGSLSRDDAKCLLRRSTIAVSTPPNSVIYLRDLRLQSMLNLRDIWDVNKLMFARVTCHLLILMSTKGMYSDEKFVHQLDEAKEFFKSRAKTFHVQPIEGDHYIHMNNFKPTAEAINRYLEDPGSFKVI